MTMQVEAIVRGGVVIIPPAIKESLHLRDGDTLVFDADQDQGTVRLSVRQRASFRDFAGGAGNASEGKTIEQIVAEEREQRGY